MVGAGGGPGGRQEGSPECDPVSAVAEPVIVRLAEKYGKTPAQIVLRWHLQLGNVVIPRSVTPSRIKENIDVFDYGLSPQDMRDIAVLENGVRIGPDPDTTDFRG